MQSELRSVLSLMHGFFLVIDFCFLVIDFLAWYLLYVNHILNSFLTNFFFFISSLSLFHRFLYISPSLSILSISAPPAPKRFRFLRSKSQDKLLSPPSSSSPSSSRPPLSLTRRLRFWSSSDISADGITNQPMSASGGL